MPTSSSYANWNEITKQIIFLQLIEEEQNKVHSADGKSVSMTLSDDQLCHLDTARETEVWWSNYLQHNPSLITPLFYGAMLTEMRCNYCYRVGEFLSCHPDDGFALLLQHTLRPHLPATDGDFRQRDRRVLRGNALALPPHVHSPRGQRDDSLQRLRAASRAARYRCDLLLSLPLRYVGRQSPVNSRAFDSSRLF